MNILIGTFAVIGIILIIIFAPLLSIWSLNTIFPVLAIPYTWKTWLAIIIVGGFIKGFSISTKSKD